jgi:hypothetical protein
MWAPHVQHDIKQSRDQMASLSSNQMQISGSRKLKCLGREWQEDEDEREVNKNIPCHISYQHLEERGHLQTTVAVCHLPTEHATLISTASFYYILLKTDLCAGNGVSKWQGCAFESVSCQLYSAIRWCVTCICLTLWTLTNHADEVYTVKMLKFFCYHGGNLKLFL